jgi:lipopolysaccharide transport system permease protein
MKGIFLAVWNYRYFILSSIRTDFKTRFSRSKLGGLWMIIHPLSQVLIYALVLSQIMTAKLPGVASSYAYPIYLIAGMLGWSLFVEILNGSLTVFIANGNLLKKMSFPKLTLPLITIGTALVNYLLLFITTFVVFAFLGHAPLHALYWIPLLVLITLGLSIGIGLFLGTINVFIRDVGQWMTIVMQFWFWLTPVVYMVTIIPEKYHWLIMLNPMTGIIMGYHNILVYDKAPDASLLLYPALFAACAMTAALIIFRKASEEMADVL